MLEATDKCLELWRERPAHALIRDEIALLATVRLLEILGEAAKNVSTELRSAHPEIPWRQMAGTRDRLIHGYFEVDLDVVQSIIANDLPPLLTQLREMLREDA